MFKFIQALFIVALTFCFVRGIPSAPQLINEDAIFESWESWKIEHKHMYPSRFEHDRHFNTFRNNLQQIQAWNRHVDPTKDEVILGINEFADLSPAEFRATLGLKVDLSLLQEENELDNFTSAESKKRAIPTSIDYRDRGIVGPVLDQGSCGGCWAFSVVGACESANALKHPFVQLSPQQVLDCSTESVNRGCSGGDTRVAMRYVLGHGLEGISSYPYTGRQSFCRESSSRISARFRGMVVTKSGDESALARTLAGVGPLSVAIDASPLLFQFYQSGIFSSSACSPTRLNHGVVLVGYTPDYWVIKNSWGRSWGEGGFMRIARGSNMCGIATYALGAISA